MIARAGDMLGYYYQRADYTDQQFGSSDFEDYNVGPELGQANANSALAGLNEIGFTATPETVHAAFESSVASKPGIQWYPDEYESTDPTFNILGSAAGLGRHRAGPDLDQLGLRRHPTGTTSVGERFDHTFPGPGSYEVTATVSSNGLTRSWTDTITVDRHSRPMPASPNGPAGEPASSAAPSAVPARSWPPTGPAGTARRSADSRCSARARRPARPR